MGQPRERIGLFGGPSSDGVEMLHNVSWLKDGTVTSFMLMQSRGRHPHPALSETTGMSIGMFEETITDLKLTNINTIKINK